MGINTDFSEEFVSFIDFIVDNYEDSRLKKKLRKEFPKSFLKKNKQIIDQLDVLSENSGQPPKKRTEKYLLAVDRLVYQLHSISFDGEKEKCLNDDVELKSSVIAYIFSLVEKKRTLGSSWSKKQQKHFKIFFDVITKWHFCFLSYTAKSEAVSDRYENRMYIKKVKVNHIVEKIQNNFVQTGGLRKVWLDRDKLKTGDPLKQNLREACMKSLFFVQLVDEATLNQAGLNWQHYEFKKFVSTKREHYNWLNKLRSNNGVYILRLADDLTLNNYAPKDTVSWQEYCTNPEVLYAKLPYDNGDNFVAVLKKIAKELNEEKEKMIAAVPN